MSQSRSFSNAVDAHDPLNDLVLCFADAPMHRIGFAIKGTEIAALAKTYADRVFRARREATTDGLTWQTLILRFGEKLFLQALGEPRACAEIYAATEAEALALHEELQALLVRHQPPAGQPFFYMLRYDYNEFMTERVDQLPQDAGDEFLRLCYGEDILAWLEGFREKTTARAGGLSILQGPPGTGKTSLITQMMCRFAESHVFYVLPVATESALSSPELVPFWQAQNRRHPDKIKVIVLEDAERLLWARSADNRESVSSILNIADGLTGRMLRLHVLCSVNARLSELDPAVLRPGRLTCYRDFGLLPRATAEGLARYKSLAFQPQRGREEFTLAEVLNPGAFALPAKTRVGF
jgi:hypothetical protein